MVGAVGGGYNFLSLGRTAGRAFSWQMQGHFSVTAWPARSTAHLQGWAELQVQLGSVLIARRVHDEPHDANA